MNKHLTTITLFITLLFSGLIAGIFYAYSCSVNIAFETLTDPEYIRAMQAINHKIQNRLFFIPFMGLLILFPLYIYLEYRSAALDYSMIAGLLLYFTGVFGITVWGNVPLNEELAKFNISNSSAQQIKDMRLLFEKPWNKYHSYRTVCAVLSFAIALFAVLKEKIGL